MSNSAQALQVFADAADATTPRDIPADDAGELAELQHETLRNMRLLKAQVIPALGAAWRAAGAGAAASACERAQSVRTVLGLIDDTAIAAAAGITGGPVGAVDLAALFRLAADGLGPGAASVRIGPLPRIYARSGHAELLCRELLLAAVRSARLGTTARIDVGAGVDPDGNPIVWLHEAGPDKPASRPGPLRAVPPDTATRGAADIYAWSLCQRLVERNGGSFAMSGDGRGLTRVRLRFPREMLAGEDG